MRKTITYSTFLIAAIAVAITFVTAKNYTQLAFATMLYPAIAFLVLNLFPRKHRKSHDLTIQITPSINESEDTVSKDESFDEENTNTPKVEIADVDRRAFLKLIGVAGVSYFLLSIFSKRAQVPFFGKMGHSDGVSVTNTSGVAINPAERQPLDGYQIAEIDDNIISYYGFINKDGAWFIMKENTETSSFRYAKGDSNFPQGWINRAQLKYDYFSNI